MNKKAMAILALELLFCGTTLCQTGSRQFASQSKAEKIVAMLLADDGNAPIVSFTEKDVERLGDGSAVGLIEFIGDRKMNVSEDRISPQEMRRMLLIVRMSFEVPNIVEADENRTPKATLVLLKYLSSLPAAKTLQDDLRATSNTIERLKSESYPPK